MKKSGPKKGARPAPSAAELKVRSYLVYDNKTGEVLHVHHVAAAPGAPRPPESEIERLLVRHAAKHTGKRAARIGAVHSRRKNLDDPSLFRVDPATRRVTRVKRRTDCAAPPAGLETDFGSAGGSRGTVG